jgi:hypothetical protein
MTRRRRRGLIALGAGLLAAATAAVVIYATTGPTSPLGGKDPVPPVAQGPLTDTDLQQVKSVLGPFKAVTADADSPTPETNAPAVLILNQDGSTLASEKWTVPFEATQWSKGGVFQIRSQSVALGYVTIGTNLRRTFVVKANQPFIFEETPQQVHIIDGQGNTWSVTTARAEAQRQAL